ncbi:MAG: hypothetical protein D4R65_10480 [Verrucomicrobiaceae bacterium]|nr:MAG: hypothetical protein D4R65_10480 [Verrucomicrobiaceae bacterium]
MGHVTAQTPTPTPPPTTSVQIINATSVPAISLYVNGRENYPNFPQALLTSDAPIPLLDTRYVAVNKKTGAQAESDVVKFQANANQSLVIMGDFSTQTPPGALPQPDQPLGKTEKPYPPNVVFKVFQHKRMSADRLVRLLVINGMPGKRLKFTAGNDARDILPGESVEFVEQPVFFTYQADAGDQQIAVTVRQSGIMRDAIVIFYLKNGEPAFMRAFENTVLSSPES